jgi:hypothetical protein
LISAIMSGGEKRMRRLLVAAAAALSLAAASSLVAGRAEALPLPGAGALGAAGQTDLAQDVRTVCRPVWNGFRWVQSCYWVPGPSYYGPPRYYRHHRHHHHRHHHRRW